MTSGAPTSFKVSQSGTFEIECFILSLLFLSLSPECHLWTRLASFQSWDKAHGLKEGIKWKRIALLFIWRNALVCKGCRNEIPQSTWPKEQKLFSSQFWRLDVQDQGVSRAVFFLGLSPWTIDGFLLTVSPHYLLCVQLLFLKGHQPYWIITLPSELILM